jgi:multicomponent Na+:H+ antiporter subunit D
MSIEGILDTILYHSPALIVAIPLLGAFLTPLVSRIGDRARNGFAIGTLAVTGFIISLLSWDILTNNSIRTYVFGAKDATLPVVRILFEVDAMNVLMILIGIILAFVAVIYSWGFMKEYTGLDKYYTLVLLMSAGMFGMMLTGDLFNFFVFLEITSIASCALIAFWTTQGESIEAAFKYIVISAIGALFVLMAIAIFYGEYNALNIAVIANNIQYSFLDKIALVLLIAALAMKAGIVPMHMWLPDSYGRAPAAVTLMLVAATQASLYGVIRVCFTLYGKTLPTLIRTIAIKFDFIGHVDITTNIYLVTILGIILIVFALITMLIGVFMAIKQSDFKRLIAYAAVAEIGFMVLGIGVAIASINPINGTMTIAKALQGGLFHILNDALDIGLLFLVAGAVYYATKERSLDALGGLARQMKYTSIFFLIGLFAVAGMPPMNGFASKLIIYESTYQLNPILAIIAILSSIMLLAVFVKVFHSAFLGPALPQFKAVKEVPKSMLLGMGIIVAFIIIFSLFPQLVLTNIIEPAANALINYTNYLGIFGGS